MKKYHFLEKIGRGTHGTVYLLQSPDHEGFVVSKTVSEKNMKYALREINILSKLNNKRIVRLIENIKHENTFYLILEYANHGSLENIINYHKKNDVSLNLDTKYHKLIWDCLSQIIDGICYLHSKKIIHRDIKPSNILVNQYFIGKEEILEYKICDFSLSSPMIGTSNNIVGTPFYMAPEIINKDEYDGNVDVWSLGICLFEMVALKRPFNGKTRKELQINILNDEINHIPNIEDDNPLFDIIMKSLKKDPLLRSTAIEIRKIDKIKYCIAISEIKQREKKILQLEKKLKDYETGLIYLPSPEQSIKKNNQER
jgi:NIMA (never in mitosis gene a)-related kinase